jgi:hypothetical protein
MEELRNNGKGMVNIAICKYIHCKKRFPARKSLVSDIPLGTEKSLTFVYSVRLRYNRRELGKIRGE